jgi:hypothetical protein
VLANVSITNSIVASERLAISKTCQISSRNIKFKIKTGPTSRAIGRFATFRFPAFFRSKTFSRFDGHSRGKPLANANRWVAPLQDYSSS